MNDSSISRIQQLRNEIAKLDQRISESTAESPSAALTLLDSSPVTFKRSQDRSDLQHKVNSMRASITLKEERFSKQKDDISSRLRDLARLKQGEVLRRRSEREGLLRRVNDLKSDIQEMYEAYHASSLRPSREQKAAHQVILQEYAEILRPLEHRSSILAEAKATILVEQKQLEELRASKESSLSMCCEERDSRAICRIEYIMQREELEEVLEQLILENPHDFDVLEGSQEDLTTLSLAKEAKISGLNAIDRELREVNDQLSLVKGDLEHQRLSNEAELRDAEKCIRLCSDEAGVPSLDDVILDLNCTENFDLDEEILRTQLELIEDKLRETKSHWETTERQIRGKLQTAENERDWESLKEELSQLNRQHINREASVRQWKSEVEGALGAPTPSTRVRVTDNRIIEEFKSLLSPRLQFLGKRRSIEKTLQIYIQQLQQRENSQRRGQTDAWKQVLQTSFDEKTRLEAEKVSMRKELMSLIIEQKTHARRTTMNDSQTIEEAQQLRQYIDYWESLVNRETHIIHNSLANTHTEHLKQLTLLSHKTNVISNKLTGINREEHSTNSAIESLLETQRREMADSLEELNQNPLKETKTLNKLKIHMEEKTETLEAAKIELNEFDSKHLGILAKIEQEEAILRSQQQMIASGLKTTHYERGKMKEMELRLSRVQEPSRPPDLKPKSIFQEETAEEQCVPLEMKEDIEPSVSQSLSFIKKQTRHTTYNKKY